jgi:ABC-type multidrug transport system ATPase subunit
MYLVCPKCRRAAPSILIKTGFTCPFCQNSWEAPAIQFSQAYFCDLNSLSVALLAAGGERFRINTFPAVLGRDSEFKELQRNLAVSRNHFRIDANGTNISVTDLGSRGGTFLNQSQLAPNLPQPFNPGDVLRVSGVELTLELVFSPTKGRSQPIAPGPETIQLSNSNPILTIGGIASTANIKLAHLVYPEIIGCLHTQTAGDTWEVLALKHGSILANGESVLEYRLQPDDDITIGQFRYTYRAEDACLCPAQIAEAIGLAARKICFSTRTPTGQKDILNDATLDIPASRLTAIIGESGSGKSTLAKILIGALVARSGELSFAGQSILPSAYPEKIAGRVAFVPQDDIIHQELTIQETMDYAAAIRLPRSAASSEKEARINRVLDELELAEHRHKLVNALSGGQRKRVNVAVELLSSPNILFLDEPTTGLDTGAEEQILKCLHRLARQGRTVVFITHSIRAMDQADHVVFLHDDGTGGRVLAQGSPDALKQQHHLKDWATLFNRTETRTTASNSSNAGRPTPLSKLALQSPGFVTLFLRYVSIWAATPIASLLILLGLPVALGLLIRLAVPTDGPSGSDRILFGVICAFWLGMNQTVREIVKERTVMLREQFAGASSAAYLISKVGFFFLIGFFQAGLLVTPMLWLRVDGSSLNLGPSDMFCPPMTFWLVLWAGLCVGASFGLLLSVLCLYVRTKGEIFAVLLVILMTLPQILFSPKVLDHLVEKTTDYHSFTLIDPSRKLAEILSYFTASRYLYLPMAAIQNQRGQYLDIFAFNGTILAAFSLSCLILAWLFLELFIQHQRSRTHW